MNYIQVIVIDPKQKKLYKHPCKYEKGGDITPGLSEIIGTPDIVTQNQDGLKSFLSSESDMLGKPKYDYNLYGQDSAYLKGEGYFEFGGIHVGVGTSVIFAYDWERGRFVNCQYKPEKLQPHFRFLTPREAAVYKNALLLADARFAYFQGCTKASSAFQEIYSRQLLLKPTVK